MVVDEPLTASDVLIVLSGNPERELYAVELYRSGLAEKIVMSGPSSAVRAMKKRAVERGVEAGDIILEEESWSTYQNAVNSRAIVLQQEMKSAIVITSDYHARRSRMVFRRVFKDTGINLIFSAAPGLSPGADIEYDEERRRQVLKEYVKLVYYWLRYW